MPARVHNISKGKKSVSNLNNVIKNKCIKTINFSKLVRKLYPYPPASSVISVSAIDIHIVQIIGDVSAANFRSFPFLNFFHEYRRSFSFDIRQSENSFQRIKVSSANLYPWFYRDYFHVFINCVHGYDGARNLQANDIVRTRKFVHVIDLSV